MPQQKQSRTQMIDRRIARRGGRFHVVGDAYPEGYTSRTEAVYALGRYDTRPDVIWAVIDALRAADLDNGDIVAVLAEHHDIDDVIEIVQATAAEYGADPGTADLLAALRR